MGYSADEFLHIIKPMVIKDMQTSGILCSLTGSQALIESNKGNSSLAVKGNNLFGMKGAYNGQSVLMPTKEWDGTKYITINAPFRKYPSWADSIADHSALFNRSARYENLRGLKDYKLACIYVKQDGYATSPTYTQTLLKTIETYKLWTWDLEAQGLPVELPKTGNPYPEPMELIKLKSRGNGVRWLQWQLNDKGGYKLIIDGIAGPLTIGALQDFQRNQHLVVDGICGPKTRAALLK